MLKVSELTNKKVLLAKTPKKAKDGTLQERWSRLGRVHMAVFTPDGAHICGLMVKRPDVAGVVKRDDVFLAWDSFKRREKDLVVNRPADGMDDAARKRLGIDWDKCIMWAGMDVKTVEGEELGYVSDAEFDEMTGEVTRFFSSDGGVSHALVGSFEIKPSMVRGYSKGCMIVDTGGEQLELNGGAAAKAGEGYARAKASAAEAGKKAGAAAEKAVDKGSRELGRAIGKASKAGKEAAKDLDLPSGDEAAKAVGRQLGSFGKMFGGFADEFKKASK